MNFRNILLTGAALLSFAGLKAQQVTTNIKNDTVTTLEQSAEDIILSKNDFVIDRAYAGSLSNMNFPVEKLQSGDAATSVRIGVGATYIPADWFEMNSWATLDQSKFGSFSLEMFKAKANLTNNLSVSVGKLPKASGNLRPHPVSGNGHFETWTESQIPGLGKGARVDAKAGNVNITGSVTVDDNNDVEYNVSTSFSLAKNPMQFAGWFTDQQNFGAASSASYRDLLTVVVYKRSVGQDIVANKLIWNPNGGKVIFYNDAGYDLDARKFVREENGVLFASTVNTGIDKTKIPVGILTGAGYDAVSKEVKAYLFVTLEYMRK